MVCDVLWRALLRKCNLVARCVVLCRFLLILVDFCRFASFCVPQTAIANRGLAGLVMGIGALPDVWAAPRPAWQPVAYRGLPWPLVASRCPPFACLLGLLWPPVVPRGFPLVSASAVSAVSAVASRGLPLSPVASRDLQICAVGISTT